MYRTLETITHVTIVGALVLFIIIFIYMLNIVINNILVISLGLVIILSAISLALPRGVTGIILFGFFLSFLILSIMMRDIEMGLLYGSIIMSFLVIFNIFRY